MSTVSAKPREWDADTYNRVAAPQEAWAEETLSRVRLRGDEVLLDAGCGSGGVTEKLIERLPEGRVIAVDGSADMVRVAKERLGTRADVRLVDLSQLNLDGEVDVVFSNAVFHWILDHENLFRRLHAALRPGGRLIVQCGGHGNIARVKESIAAVAERNREMAVAFDEMPAPWNYATPEETRTRLEAAGFGDVRTWLADRPASPGEPREFLRTVILGPYLEAIRPELHDELIDGTLAGLGDPPVFDYVRLNLEATR